MSQAEARAKKLWRDIGPEVERAYLDAILALRPTKKTADLKVVYTAMHGVGGALVRQSRRSVGQGDVDQTDPVDHLLTVLLAVGVFHVPVEPDAGLGSSAEMACGFVPAIGDGASQVLRLHRGCGVFSRHHQAGGVAR